MKALAVCGLLFILGCRKDPPPGQQHERPIPEAPPARTTSSSGTVAADVVCTSAPRRLCPVDEGSRDPSFAAFRQEWLALVERRDGAGLLQHVDPGVRTSFGDGGGIADFEKQWNVHRPDSALWTELRKVLGSGGSFRDTSFWAPYVYANWPESIDAFQHVAAIRADVAVRRNPDPQAPPVAMVDWEILELRPDSARHEEWVSVKTPAGDEGWVYKADVHSPVGYRAGFSKRTGSWRLEAFVAGD